MREGAYAIGRFNHARHIGGQKPDDSPWPPGLGLCTRLTTSPRKQYMQRNVVMGVG
jgi:hypothetical protein